MNDKLLAGLIEQLSPGETIIEIIEPPPAHERPERDRWAGIAEAYAITRKDDCPCGGIVFGLYRGAWHANPSCRWLVMHLLERKCDG